MSCLDDRQLEQYVSARLNSASLLAADAHLRTCEQCRNRLQNLRLTKAAVGSLAAQIASLHDCPDYETLSAFLDGALGKPDSDLVRAHINSCYLCHRDVQRMQELRAQAHLRGLITVEPKTLGRGIIYQPRWWKVVAAAGTAAVALAALILTLNKPSGKVNVSPATIARHSETPRAPTPKIPRPTAVQTSKQTFGRAVTPQPKQGQSATVTAALLRDGSYKLVKSDGRYVLLGPRSQSIRTPFEARVARLIAEKVRTGNVRPAKPISVALNAVRLRDSSGFVPEPTAPKLLRPVGITVIEDRPVFSWSKADLAESYRLIIADQSGNVVYEATVTDTQFKIERPLQRGRVYLWRVGAKFGESDGWSNSAAGAFRVLSSSELSLISAVKRAMPGSHLALAVVYESLGLHSEAAKEYQIVRVQNPNSAIARRLVVR